MGWLRRIRWALRKVSLPVPIDGLVLDVGSGGAPYPRSDVLLDRPTGAVHRCGAPLVVDRPIVLGDALKMPFKDKVFDFVVASHILEHMQEPARFLDELSRVGKAGYIETPNVVFERVHPYTVHCLEIMSLEGRLHIRTKGRVVEDPFMGDLAIDRRDAAWSKLFHGAPDLFHVRHFWSGSVHYSLWNADEDCSWLDALPTSENDSVAAETYGGRGWRAAGLKALRRYYRWRRSGRAFEWPQILACPECRGDLEFESASMTCPRCVVSYAGLPYPDFTRERNA